MGSLRTSHVGSRAKAFRFNDHQGCGVEGKDLRKCLDEDEGDVNVVLEVSFSKSLAHRLLADSSLNADFRA